MFLNFEDNHPDVPLVGHALSWREVALLTAIFHALFVLAILATPSFDSDRQTRIAQQIALQRQREREATRFVFVQPHLDMPAVRPPSLRAEASDKDRNAQSPERAKTPTNALPFARGNSRDRTEAVRPAPPPPQMAQAQPQPAQPADGNATPDPGSPPPAPSVGSLTLPGRAGNGHTPESASPAGAGAGRGLLGSAMRDLRQMVQQNAFDNTGGEGGAFGPSIQFDTKGVEFGPWIRRFIAQIKRNWMIPYAAMAMKGHVVVTFYIQKDGTITSLSVPGPCNVDAFNRAAYGAMAASNPTYPLPPEYPADRAFFTVTFYYNEVPPGG